MGMKPPKNEPQSQLAPCLVSGPKDAGEFPPEQNLCSSMKNAEESHTAMPANVLVSGSTQKPG